MALSYFSFAEENDSNKSGSRIFFCHGEKEIFICFGWRGNQTRIAGLVGGRSSYVLAGPSCKSDIYHEKIGPLTSEENDIIRITYYATLQFNAVKKISRNPEMVAKEP